jgi:ribosomal protein S8E
MSRTDLHELDKVAEAIKNELGEYHVTYDKPQSTWDHETTRTLTHMVGSSPRSLDIRVDRYSYREGFTWTLTGDDPDGSNPAHFRYDADLYNAAAALADAFNKHMAATRAERERKEAEARERYAEEERKRREAAAAAREARAKVVAEREERLLTEFMGENVRVRVGGYRSAVKATVDARPVQEYKAGEGYVDTGKFKVVIEYVNENDWNRPNRVGDIERLEVKVGSRYELVWDDNPDAIGSGARDVKAYDGALDND